MRRSLTAIVTAAALIGGAAASDAQATVAADRAAAARAAAWLEAQPSSEMAGGQQADAIVALRAAGRSPGSLSSRLRRLAADGPGYARTPGAAAKVALAAVAADADPSSLGGVDYLRRVRAGSAGGRYGATAFDQALAMLALRAAGRPVPRAALRLLRRTRGRGGWNLGLSGGGADEVDTTGLVIEAMRAAGAPARDRALRSATAWMLRQRNRQGGLASAGGRRATEANATAAAIRALRAMGRRPPASMRAALRSLQERDGAVRFRHRDAGSRLLATNDAIVALAGRRLPVRG